MISGPVCDEAEPFERHLRTFDLGVDVVSSGDVADDNSSDDSWGYDLDELPGLLRGDDSHEAKHDYRDGPLASHRYLARDDSPDAKPTVELEQDLSVSQHRGKLQEGELRLVQITLGKADELVRCSTRIVPVSSKQKYLAVSYAWGPPIAAHTIELDGRPHKVATNLWHFLKAWRSGPFFKEYRATKRQRREACKCWLWVDALSIDQSDVRERMHQVRIMSRIFGGARDVIVWLGLGNEGVRDLMHRAVFSDDPSPQWVKTHAAAIEDLGGRSYWRRLWIFQDLKSAKEVRLMCGADTLAWKDFKSVVKVGNNAVDSIHYNPVMSESVASVRRRMYQHVTSSAAQRMVDLCGSGTPTSLWLLLQVTEHLECYDRRDEVYSLLSMAETGCEGIEADYDLSLPQLMHRVLHNLHASCEPPSAHEIAIHCARLTEVMKFTRPWGVKEYLAEEKEIDRKEISQDGGRS